MTRARKILFVVLAAAAAALLVERLVVTDREAIEKTIADAADAVERNDWDALARTIDDDYNERGRDKRQLVEWARSLWRMSGARTVAIDVGDVRVEGDRAAARVVVRPGLPWAGQRFPGDLEFRRTHDGWRIVSVGADESRLLEPGRFGR